MPFFIKHAPKTLWDVYLVEADSLADVMNPDHDAKEELVGDFLDVSGEACQIFGPFETKEEALADDKAWVE